MNIRIITASAGSGKTTRLSQVLDEAIGSGAARPEGIVATTFTREAAAELVERARSRLLASGRGREAQKLLAARIGTVSSVCGALVAEFAFELGLSPAPRVVDETTAELEQKKALAAVVDVATAGELDRFRDCFQADFAWPLEVRAIIAAARANGLGAADLAASAERSIAALDASLPPCEPDAAAIDDDLRSACDRAADVLRGRDDDTRVTRDYLDRLAAGARRWGDWAMLCKERPSAKAPPVALDVARVAERHVAHPRLRADLHRLIRLLFSVAADGLGAYERHKREHGLVDFADQEALALTLLGRPDVRAALRGELDLVLVDEFQDTSPLQLAIFLELAGLARQSVWVGDQKQAIYGFRGTDPALMDAVIESLTPTSTDPDLVSAAVASVGAAETLSISYRSRPALVAVMNDLFAPAFAAQGIPEERTRLRPVRSDEPAGLGPVAQRWSLVGPKRLTKSDLAAAVATGVRDLLASGARVRDRVTGAARPVTAADVAVLARTNAEGGEVAEALGERGVAAVIPRTRLLDTAEGQLVVAGLRLWVDPGDALAAATLARLGAHPDDPAGFVARALGTPAWADDPIARAITAARVPDADPVRAVAGVVDASSARELCASWGRSAQRRANLDALHAHAVAYVDATLAARGAPTLVGFITHLEVMANERGDDRQAVVAGDDAVTVSTWHRAKGREWPIVVLFGLETLREPSAFGLSVETDAPRFDPAAPLAGRWLRYWPNPYTNAAQGGPVRARVEATQAYASVVGKNEREVLRLLYVGCTRARDRVIFAAAKGKLGGGLCRPLGFTEDTSSAETLPVQAADAPASAPSAPGEVTVGRPAASHPPARLLPSAMPPVPCRLGPPVVLGPRLAIASGCDMERVGRAVHAYLAADAAELSDDDCLEIATAVLGRHGVADDLAASDLVAAGARLRGWLGGVAATRCHREWPVRLVDGATVVGGSADLVFLSPTGYGVVDHKTFPGSLGDALARLPAHSGQLSCYARAVREATGVAVTSTWIHLPILGTLVEVRLGAGGGPTATPA